MAIAIVIVTGVVGAVLLVNSLQGTVLTTSAPAPTAGPAPAPPGTSSENGDPRSCDAAAGSSRFDTEFTGADGQPVPYSVSLPADYYTECREYPVLFALHGRDQNNATFLPQAEELRGAVDAGVLDDVVIVTPDSDLDGRWEGRHSTTFIDELVPHIEQSYRVQTGSAYRLLVGWSMGGHGAFQFGIEHPEMFAAVWAVDGAMSREPTDYLKFLNPAVADDLKITSVGGNLNGDRVEEVINLFARHGVELPYERLPLDHEFTHFVQADRDAGWPTMTWMNAQLSQSP